MSLSGNKLAGSNPKTERVRNDYYATDPVAVKMILDKYAFFEEPDILKRWI